MAVVIDEGTLVCKGGLAGDTTPRVNVNACVGYAEGGDVLLCDAAWRRRKDLSLVYPIEDGIVQHWGEMELVWGHVFESLRVRPDAQPVLLTETPLNPPLNREKSVQVMFEQFGAPALYMAGQPLLSLLHLGLDTALVIKVGTDSCSAVPIYQGQPQYLAIENTAFGGRDLSNHLLRMLAHSNQVSLDPANWNDWDGVGEIKEKLGYCALDLEEEVANFDKLGQEVLRPFSFPDGKRVVVGREQFMCAEPLFRPSLLGEELKGVGGVAEQAWRAVGKCAAELQPHLWRNVVLLGATTHFHGLPHRLQKELAALAPEHDVRVLAPDGREVDASFAGGAKLASSEQFGKMCITKEEYDEVGPSAVHSKCL